MPPTKRPSNATHRTAPRSYQYLLYSERRTDDATSRRHVRLVLDFEKCVGERRGAARGKRSVSKLRRQREGVPLIYERC